ncbi:MAG: 4Fe-4S cluster-binding domain-containing protein, partial [Gemmataceae bacterium]
EGITLLGGEPLAHARGAAALASSVQQMGMTVMVFSGYLLEEARESQDPHVGELLQHTDILVDGKYDRDLPETKRRWIGSSNQRIHFLTNRYQMDESWSKSNTLEIRLKGGSLTVNGFPSGSAVGLWKKPPRPSTSARQRKDTSD